MKINQSILISEMKVSFWPEYDRQSILVIYKGRFSAHASMPATVQVLIPKSSGLTSTAAIGSDGQFQYEHAWASHEITPGPDYDILTYETMYPRFQCELYFYPIGANKQRNFDFTFKTAMAADSLQIEIQKPLKAADFKIKPPTANTAIKDGFTYYLYNFNSPKAGQEINYQISYTKNDYQTSISEQGSQ